jgi:ribonuclease D
LKRDYGFVFKNIFDTYRAASLLGSSHLSLVNVVGQYLGIEFEKKKKMQRSRWDLRPLTEEQLHYAALDTAYLPDLYHCLEEELQRAGLGDEAAKIFADMTKIKWHKKDLDKEGYKKIARYYTLTDTQRERLKHLFRWRYGKAKEINRAIFMILSDQDLVELSALEVGSVHELQESGFLPGEKLHLFGAELVELLDGDRENTQLLA